MSVRKGYKDIIEGEDIVRVVIDMSGVLETELHLKVSSKTRTLFIKHDPSGSVLEIKIPCAVREKFDYSFNNGVLDVEIKK